MSKGPAISGIGCHGTKFLPVSDLAGLSQM